MEDHNPAANSGKVIPTFLAVAFGLAVVLGLIVGLTGGYRSPLIGLQFLSMFIPAVAVLGVRPLTSGAVENDWRRFPWPYVPVALLLIGGLAPRG